MKFKIGQKVRVVKLGMIGGESQSWIEQDGLNIGDIVTISEINDTFHVRIREGKKAFWIHGDHFEEIKEPRKIPLRKTLNLRRG